MPECKECGREMRYLREHVYICYACATKDKIPMCEHGAVSGQYCPECATERFDEGIPRARTEGEKMSKLYIPALRLLMITMVILTTVAFVVVTFAKDVAGSIIIGSCLVLLLIYYVMAFRLIEELQGKEDGDE